MKKSLALLSICASIYALANDNALPHALANDNSLSAKITENSTLSIGVARVKSHEYSVSGAEQLSYLEWRAKSVPYLSLSFQSVIFKGIVLESSAYYGLGGSGTLVDDDWLDGIDLDTGEVSPTRDPLKHTHRSTHDAKVEKFRGYDMALKTLPFAFGAFDISAGVGLRYDAIGYSANDGVAMYNCTKGYPNGCDEPYKLSGKVITYEQEFYAPYVGVYAGIGNDRLYASAGLKYSEIAQAKDFDNHIERTTTFQTDSSRVRFVDISASAYWAIDASFLLRADFGYTKYKRKTSDVIINSPKDGWGVATGSSAFDYESLRAMIGFGKYF